MSTPLTRITDKGTLICQINSVQCVRMHTELKSVTVLTIIYCSHLSSDDILWWEGGFLIFSEESFSQCKIILGGALREYTRLITNGWIRLE